MSVRTGRGGRGGGEERRWWWYEKEWLGGLHAIVYKAPLSVSFGAKPLQGIDEGKLFQFPCLLDGGIDRGNACRPHDATKERKQRIVVCPCNTPARDCVRKKSTSDAHPSTDVHSHAHAHTLVQTQSPTPLGVAAYSFLASAVREQ